jgi:hypothetical protein
MTASRSSDHHRPQVLDETQALQPAHRLPDAQQKAAKLSLTTGWKNENGK